MKEKFPSKEKNTHTCTVICFKMRYENFLLNIYRFPIHEDESQYIIYPTEINLLMKNETKPSSGDNRPPVD